jgi:hypothetical protein
MVVPDVYGRGPKNVDFLLNETGKVFRAQLYMSQRHSLLHPFKLSYEAIFGACACA